MGMKDYILVTPCKNEEESLPKLAESIINQKLKPKLWVIVDDGSTDKTPEIIKSLQTSYPWIQSIKLPLRPRDITFHYSYVCKQGFDHAINYCKDKNMNYSYIGNVDADIILEYNYFEFLIEEFEKNVRLGICSGHVGNIINNKVIWSSFRKDLPSGGARLWRKECFEDTEGYLLTCSPDSVSNVKAIIKGWDIRQFENVKIISTRAYASAEGQWKGYKKLGENNYFIGYTPIHVVLKGVKLLYSRNNYFKEGVGLAYVVGYFTKYIKKAPRINDPEVINYYKKDRMREILCSKMKFLNIKK